MFYTYSIKNIENGKFYIGSRTNKCMLTRKPEDDLGVKYFSSSTDKELRQAIKDGKVKYTVLQEYDDTIVCWRAEQQLIALYWKFFGKDMSYNHSCVNCNGEVIFSKAGLSPSEESRKKMSEAKKGKTSNMKGRHLSEEAKQILSQKMTGRYIGRQMSEQQKHKISEKLLGHAVSNDARKKMREAKLGKTGPWLGEHRDNKTREKISLKLKNSKWMTNGEMVKYVSPEETKIYLEMGWVFGRKIK